MIERTLRKRANMTPERKVVVITGASRGVNTIPGMPCINHNQYDIDGIRVERFTTARSGRRKSPHYRAAALRPLHPNEQISAAMNRRSRSCHEPTYAAQQ